MRMMSHNRASSSQSPRLARSDGEDDSLQKLELDEAAKETARARVAAEEQRDNELTLAYEVGGGGGHKLIIEKGATLTLQPKASGGADTADAKAKEDADAAAREQRATKDAHATARSAVGRVHVLSPAAL